MDTLATAEADVWDAQCARVRDVLEKFPEARAFSELRRRWVNLEHAALDLEADAKTARQLAEKVYGEVERAAALLPAEVREALIPA